MADFALLRKKMVDNQLRTSNVTDRRVLEAMGRVPRELFVPEKVRDLAYADRPHALGNGRALAAAAPLAKLLQLAEIRPSDMALDVGAGTGYVTAVLALLAREATGLEPETALASAGNQALAAAGVANGRIITGPLDGSGLNAVYDVIVLAGAVATVPPAFFAHLAEGGRLVALITGDGAPVATLYVRSGDDLAERREFNTVLPPLAAAPAAEIFRF